jgi:PhoH-like ATPase
MPLPTAPQKPADKLSNLPTTASDAAHNPQAATVLRPQRISAAPQPVAVQVFTTSTANTLNSVQAEAHTVNLAPALSKQPSPSTVRAPTQLGNDNSKGKGKGKGKGEGNSKDKNNTVSGNHIALQGNDARKGTKKLYVLDTNVLLHDPSSLFRFDEHDVFLPMVVLEELDNHKKGTSEVARHARQVSRTLDRLVNQPDGNIATGIPLRAADGADFVGYLQFQTDIANSSVPAGLQAGVPDHLILGEVERLVKNRAPQAVVLVSKDINIRLKATVLGLAAQDYLSDNTAQDSDTLHTGWVDASDWPAAQLSLVEQWQDNGIAHIKLAGKSCGTLPMNSFVLLPAKMDNDGFFDLGARVIDNTGKHAVLKAVRDFTLPKHAVWGVQARNLEQNAALNLLMNPEVDCVSLLGQAGTGKTLLALAAGLAQVLDKRIYSDIILTRATVSVGDDIGFLPGTEEEKMAPWMGAVEDNLEVLLGNNKTAHSGGVGGAWGQQASLELVRSRIKIKSMAFMRGRTFQNKFVIVDEAQNLTPKQMKTLVTRAGPGTKFVCLGNLAQIDTPYLTEHSSGLGYVIERFKGWPHGGHVTLARGERSRLAEFASEVL